MCAGSMWMFFPSRCVAASLTLSWRVDSHSQVPQIR